MDEFFAELTAEERLATIQALHTTINFALIKQETDATGADPMLQRYIDALNSALNKFDPQGASRVN